jgi:hypothetical protein
MFSSFFNAGKPTYQIEQSLRFSTDEYLTRTNSTASTDGQYGTLSVWYKMDSTTASSQLRTIIAGENSTYGHQFRFYTSKTDLHTGVWGSVDGGAYSVADFRDDSAWYHFLWKFDKTQSGAATVSKLWVNGVEQSQTTAGNYSFQNWGITNNGSTVRIGHYQGNGSTQYARLKGYIAEMHVVDGALKAATDFGEYDDNGVWRPIKYTGTYGNNGFYLKFDPSAANGIGHDHSGNGNNFTAYNFNTSGTGTDVMSDTPTTNYPTINPIAALDPGEPYNITGIKNGNLDVDNVLAAGSGNNTVVATFQVPTSGKWYWEVTCREYSTAAPTRTSIGVMSNACIGQDAGDFVYADVAGVYSYAASGVKCTSPNLGTSSYGSSYGVGDVIGVAFDADNGDLYFYKNGTAQNSGTAAFTGLDMTNGFYPAVGYWGDFTFNFGQRAFEQTVPSGFKALNTSNLPAPTVKDGSQYFNTVLYTGNGSTQSITGVGFQPDWVWLKSRNNAYHNYVFDAVRGTGKQLYTNLTNEEFTSSGTLTSFDTDGFSIGNSANADINNSGATFVAWNWLAGNSTSSNTDGSITSTVSASPTSGFSIVKWTGTDTAESIGHGLGVTPNWIIHKFLSASNWSVYTTTTGLNDRLKLNSSDAETSDGGVTAVSSTTFSLSAAYNDDVSDHIAYCFAEVEGYSKFGSYTGNGSSDGPFVQTGFSVSWLMVKNTTTAQGWYISDNKRDTYNQVNRALFASSSSAESSSTSGASYDFLSNGFKPRTSNNDSNGSGDVYVFMAFAENPFGGSGVSPATAR